MDADNVTRRGFAGAPTQKALAHSETVIGRIVELFGLDSVGTRRTPRPISLPCERPSSRS